MEDEARYGWESDFPRFQSTSAREIRGKLLDFICDASPEQIRAWDESIPKLQHEVGEVVKADAEAPTYTAILEYELPMESRRPDVVLLVRGSVVVLELKGKLRPSLADLDQAAAYARDLECYHRECMNRPVIPVVVPTRARGYQGEDEGVHIVGPDELDALLERISKSSTQAAVPAARFLAADAYRPLPKLVDAARELFHRGDLTPIHRARAATDPAVEEISRIIHDAARTNGRRLILVSGIPGAGKTLVGLRTVHAHFLDDLAVPRADGKPTAPAVFLSGNGPLVQVLQYELRGAGGGGKTFVRDVKNYVKRYSGSDRVPPEHVLVFDEAQRAFDAEQVQAKHQNTPGFQGGRSEPEHFIEFAERVPKWCVVVALIGGGQEIHVGEEKGLIQWRHAVEAAARSDQWKVHGPELATSFFAGGTVPYAESSVLNLDQELRFHSATDLHRFVAQILEGSPAARNAELAHRLEQDRYKLRITRQIDNAKQHLRDRYASDPAARYGLVASSRDRDLEAFGVENTFNATRNVRFGPWYSDSEESPGGFSCRHLEVCVTEFGAQGLELENVLLAWGTDLCWKGSHWSSEKARRYQARSRVKDPHQLRLNAYRVLLTRGRDGSVVFVPSLRELDATYEYLVASGFRRLEMD